MELAEHATRTRLELHQLMQQNRSIYATTDGNSCTWRPPLHNLIKINTDPAIRTVVSIQVSIMARNNSSKVICASTKHFAAPRSPLIVEAIAILFGLQMENVGDIIDACMVRV